MYVRISVDVSDVEPKVTISPAACQVVPRGEPVALEQHDVLAQVGQVVGDRGADDAAADHDDAGALREDGLGHAGSLGPAPHPC